LQLSGPPVSKRQIREAVRALRRGGVVAYPTEGCFGLGCDPRNVRAVQNVLRLKNRNRRHGLILIGSHWNHIAPWVETLDQAAVDRARKSWPGPFTWLLPARSGVSRWLRGEHDTIAVRVTAHPLAAALCRGFNSAIVSTSANLRGGRPAVTAAQVLRLFGGRLDFILAGRLGGSKGPTEIRDARSGALVRAG
jgi:L-threonylcarbamoyladenylate synthase